MKCVVCDKEKTEFQWSDTHGVGVCWQCGMPYTIYHYEGEGEEKKRVDKEPTPAVFEEWIPVARSYWQEKKMRVFPAAYDMGFFGRSGRDGRTYSGATHEDCREWDEWLEAHKSELPPRLEEAAAA